MVKVHSPDEQRVVIIGGMKCGTTSLHAYMDAHPSITMSQPKELDFFIESKNWRRGPIWYRRMLRRGRTAETRWFGEASPNYTKADQFPGVPARMAATQPAARLILLVRDPFERMRSHFGHTKLNRGAKRGLRDALLPGRESPLVQASMYFDQLSRYRPHFSDEQILVLASENLRDERRRTLQRVFRFLDVDPGFWSDTFESHHHVNPANIKARPPAIDEICSRLPDDVFEEIHNALAEDTRALRAWTGQRFDQWPI